MQSVPLFGRGRAMLSLLWLHGREDYRPPYGALAPAAPMGLLTDRAGREFAPTPPRQCLSAGRDDASALYAALLCEACQQAKENPPHGRAFPFRGQRRPRLYRIYIVTLSAAWVKRNLWTVNHHFLFPKISRGGARSATGQRPSFSLPMLQPPRLPPFGFSPSALPLAMPATRAAAAAPGAGPISSPSTVR